MKLFVFLFTICLCSCFHGKRTITVHSDYPGNFDSLVVKINDETIFSLSKGYYKMDTIKTFDRFIIKSTHDIWIDMGLYNGGKVLDSFFSFNDLGGVPNMISIIITDSLKLKVKFDKVN
jgi:hypothetical protein